MKTTTKVPERRRPCWRKATARGDPRGRGRVPEVLKAKPFEEGELALPRSGEEVRFELLGEGEVGHWRREGEGVGRSIRLEAGEGVGSREFARDGERGRSFPGPEEAHRVRETEEEASSPASWGRAM